MANSKFEYVRKFETDDSLLPQTYIVIRVDGRAFTKFTAEHGYVKPNDPRGLALMNQCAAAVMRDWGDIALAFGESDEYSFVLPRACNVFGRRSSKLATGIVSLFSSSFVFYWSRFFPDTTLLHPPSFDGRCVVYPTLRTVCDYFKWRQVDTHINTLYNETFWALVLKGGVTPVDAELRLKGTLSEEKHELLFSMFGINYAKLPLMYRRGSTLVRSKTPEFAALFATPTSTTSPVAPSPSATCGGSGVAAEDKPAERGKMAAAGAVSSLFPVDAQVEHAALDIPRSVILTFPDYNKSTFLETVFVPFEA